MTELKSLSSDLLFQKQKDLKLYSEEDVKNKLLLPLLNQLGYSSEHNMRFENPIRVQVGRKKIVVRSDIEILVDNKVAIVIDVKAPDVTLSESDLLQASSYAKLVDTPPALYSFATNGHDLLGINNIDGTNVNSIPDLASLIADLQGQIRPFTDIELKEVKSTLITIMATDDLYQVIRQCKKIIENKALIRSDQSFKEMTKIMLVKMNEERRARNKGLSNRFSTQWLSISASKNSCSELDSFKELFKEAVSTYKGIYRRNDPGILINDNQSLIDVVKLIEPFSLLGTGDDIKGAVYEIFLKANLRGDFDQYFTPREIVDFMVKLSKPKYKEKFVDPAAGSGGFLVAAFQYVNQAINNKHLSAHDYDIATKHLVEKEIWGQEADYDLHILTKINMIMHGDGWNNIYQGDSLKTKYLPDNYFDLVLENPPFTISYDDSTVLKQYELDVKEKKQELDLLFVEKSLNLLKPGGRLSIIIPEGMLNLKRYSKFREWLLQKCWLLSTISLPAGAFQPFGNSASKTAILEVMKKTSNIEYKPKYIFAARAEKIGYECGKSTYRRIRYNDLVWINQCHNSYSDTLQSNSRTNAKSVWIPYEDIHNDRIDAGEFLNRNSNEIHLSDIFNVESPSSKIMDDKFYNYVQVPFISDDTGTLLKIQRIKGENINGNRLNQLNPGDIFFTRINPRKRRIGVVPLSLKEPIYISNEVYHLKWHENSFLSKEEQFAIVPLLRSEELTDQLVTIATGSSSSRARVYSDSLSDLRLPKDFFEQNNLANLSHAIPIKADKIFQAMMDYANLINL